MKTGLYIHVPFCIRKCPYCDFYSVASPDESVFRKYTDSVMRNIRKYLNDNPGLAFDTVYFGGGTPSLMPVYFYREVLSEIRSVMDNDPEITMELNPKTADNHKLSQIRECGVNRISVGIQSADDSELNYLGRIHSFAEAASAVSDVKKAGFSNVSGDLMIGIKGQTEMSIVKSINALADLELTHISSYMLKIEEDTEYGRSNIASEVPDEDRTADMYLLSVKTLEKRGFLQYEISNFSLKGFESRHNLKYWNSEEYIGIGPSAHSCFKGKRYEVPRNLAGFLDNEYQNEIINEENPGSFFEKAMLALRLSAGLDLSLFPDEMPYVVRKAEKYKNTGLMELNDNVIRLTPEGFLVSNYLISDILSDF